MEEQSTTLPITRGLLRQGIDPGLPLEAMLRIVEAVQELLALPDNDFMWTSWRDAEQALAEVVPELARLRAGQLPERSALVRWFAPTCYLQEVSISSGWSDAYIQLAAWFDELEPRLWPAA